MPIDDVAPDLTVDKNDDGVISDVSDVCPSSHGEPIVTRRELWSYYCERRRDFSIPCSEFDSSSSVYYNGGAVRLCLLFFQRKVHETHDIGCPLVYVHHGFFKLHQKSGLNV
jgi:hypothetical protein